MNQSAVPRQACSLLCTIILVTGCMTTTSPERSPPAADAPVEPAIESLLGASAFPPIPYRESPNLAAVPADDPEPESIAPPPDVWAWLRARFTLADAIETDLLKSELRWLARHPAFITRLSDRAGYYLPYILHQIEDRNLPAEAALIPMIESALDPLAMSPQGAAGIWQFMPATAKRFGLRRDYWYAPRWDPVASTDAAIRYIEYLHVRFPNWLHTFAAYNAGEGKLRRALKRGGDATPPWHLPLPRETRHYVPRLLALAELIRNPDRHGVELPRVNMESKLQHLDLAHQFDLAVLAETLGTDIEALRRFNPGLRRWATPPHAYRLAIPRAEESQEAQEKLIAAIEPERRMKWHRVEVRPGDTLSEIAIAYRTDVDTIRRANQLNGTRIRAGAELLIPSSATTMPLDDTVYVSAGATHTVVAGDSLWTISRRYGMSINQLLRLNGLSRRAYLQVGQTLSLGQGANRKVSYKVRYGDSLSTIAARFGIRVRDLANWNQIQRPFRIRAGQTLVVHVGPQRL